jgi:hypothetical protein
MIDAGTTHGATVGVTAAAWRAANGAGVAPDGRVARNVGDGAIIAVRLSAAGTRAAVVLPDADRARVIAAAAVVTATADPATAHGRDMGAHRGRVYDGAIAAVVAGASDAASRAEWRKSAGLRAPAVAR